MLRDRPLPRLSARSARSLRRAPRNDLPGCTAQPPSTPLRNATAMRRCDGAAMDAPPSAHGPPVGWRRGARGRLLGPPHARARVRACVRDQAWRPRRSILTPSDRAGELTAVWQRRQGVRAAHSERAARQ